MPCSPQSCVCMLAFLEVGGQAGVNQKVCLRVFGGASRGWSESMVALGASRGWSESMLAYLEVGGQTVVVQKVCLRIWRWGAKQGLVRKYACTFGGEGPSRGWSESMVARLEAQTGVGQKVWLL